MAVCVCVCTHNSFYGEKNLCKPEQAAACSLTFTFFFFMLFFQFGFQASFGASGLASYELSFPASSKITSWDSGSVKESGRSISPFLLYSLCNLRYALTQNIFLLHPLWIRADHKACRIQFDIQLCMVFHTNLCNAP